VRGVSGKKVFGVALRGEGYLLCGLWKECLTCTKKKKNKRHYWLRKSIGGNFARKKGKEKNKESDTLHHTNEMQDGVLDSNTHTHTHCEFAHRVFRTVTL